MAPARRADASGFPTERAHAKHLEGFVAANAHEQCSWSSAHCSHPKGVQGGPVPSANAHTANASRGVRGRAKSADGLGWAPRCIPSPPGLERDRAHGVTLVGESNGDGNKIKGKSFVKREPVKDDLWQKHLDGKDSLGVIPINDDNKCKWGCIDIDSYAGFDHKKLINKMY